MLTHLIQSFGYLAVFVLMALESACIPIPSEVTMPFAGFMAEQGTFSLWPVILLGAVGNLAGSLVAYWIGHVLEERVLIGWIRRYGRFVLVTEDDYAKAARWFSAYGGGTVFAARLLPAVRTFISLPAGVFQMNLWQFSAYTFVGSLLWSAFLAYVGYYLGSQWGSITPLYSKVQYVVIALAFFAVAYYIYRKLRSTR